MLEEHIRELELQSQERLIEEQKRNKELLQRLEREKALEIENYAIRLQSSEREQAASTRELTNLRSQVDRLKTEKSHLEQELIETQQSNLLLKKECSRIEESFKKTQEQLEKALVGVMVMDVQALASNDDITVSGRVSPSVVL